MVGFHIPNEADASYAGQAEIDSQDVAVLRWGVLGSGTLTGCAVTPGNSGVDRSVVVDRGRITVQGVWSESVPKTTITSTAMAVDATHPRWALIHSAGSGSASPSVTVTLGTPAASPAFPSVTEGEVVLAAVWLPANATSITAANITDKRVIQSPQPLEVVPQSLLPAAIPKRASYARFGAPGSDGYTTLSTNTAYTLYDSSDTSYGGITGMTSSPGIVEKISLYFMSDAWHMLEIPYIKVTYDGETAPAINMPLRRWSNSGYSTAGGAHNARHPLWTFYSPGGANKVSFTFSMPIPFRTKCKIELVTPAYVGAHKVWTIVDYRIGDNGGFGDRKLRPIWWDYSTDIPSGDRMSTDGTTGRNNQTNGYMTQHHWWDCGWASRLYGALNNSATTVEVYNGPAFTRNLPVGVKDPRTGTAITNTTTALAPDVFAIIDSEVVKITAISGNTLTVARGQAHPLTGAATTAAAHSDKAMLKRIVGPTKIEMLWAWGQSTTNSDTWMESPVGLFVDADTAELSGGQLPTAGSGGMEDFYGVGWYIAAGSDTSDPYQGCAMRRAYGASFYRWFGPPGLWCADGFGWTWANGESGQGNPGNSQMASTIFAYTGH